MDSLQKQKDALASEYAMKNNYTKIAQKFEPAVAVNTVKRPVATRSWLLAKWSKSNTILFTFLVGVFVGYWINIASQDFAWGVVKSIQITPVEDIVYIIDERDAEENTAIGGSETHEETIRRVAHESNFTDADLLVRIAVCESGNQDVYNGTINPEAANPYSSARGPFQFTSGTWDHTNQLTDNDWDYDDRFDLEKSTRAAIYWLSRGYESKWSQTEWCWS